jgi:hypothetical protein
VWECGFEPFDNYLFVVVEAFVGAAVFPLHTCGIDGFEIPRHELPCFAQFVRDSVVELPADERAIYVKYGEFFLFYHSISFLVILGDSEESSENKEIFRLRLPRSAPLKMTGRVFTSGAPEL